MFFKIYSLSSIFCIGKNGFTSALIGLPLWLFAKDGWLLFMISLFYFLRSAKSWFFIFSFAIILYPSR